MKTEYSTSLKLRIDWSELDYFGHVNNVSFFKYIQAARVHYWECIGLYQHHKSTGIGPVLASTKCDFKQPLHFPGNITIHSKIAFIKTTSFGTSHQIFNNNDEIVAEANDVIVIFDYNSNQKSPIPTSILEEIEKLEKRKPSII